MLSYLRKKMKTIMIIVSVLFAATMFYGLGYRGMKGLSEGPAKDSIATVNGREIDHDRYKQVMSRLFSQEKGRMKAEQVILYQVLALQQTLDFTVMLDDAKRHFGVSGGELDEAIQQIMTANKIPNKGVLEEALKRSGQSMSTFKKNLKDEMIVAKMMNKVRSDVTIGPDDLREVRASHILVMPAGKDSKSDFEARAKAEEILARIKKGESFKALAIKYSQDMGSAKNGGDLGYFSTGMMVPEFEKAAFALKPGQLSDVVKTEYGYHIIKVEDTRLKRPKEKGKDINEEVLAEKQDLAGKKWLAGLYKDKKVAINEPLLKAHSMLIAGKIDDAISAYNQASMDNPYNPYPHLFLGDAYVKAKKTDLALLEYNKAMEASGADVNLLMAVADSYISIGKKGLALSAYRKASMLGGDNKDVHKDLKKTFSDLGSAADAANEQKELNRITKKEKFEQEIQQKIGK